MFDSNITRTLEDLTKLPKELSSEAVSYREDFKEFLKNVDRKLLTPVDDIVFSIRVRRALKKANLKTVGDVLSFRLDNLLKLNNFGRVTFMKIESAIVHFFDLNQIGTYIKEIQKIKDALVTNREREEKSQSMFFQKTIEANLLRSTDKKLLKTLLDELDFSVRLSNGLKKTGLNTIEDVLIFEFINFLRIKNFGKKSLNELKEKINHFCKENSPKYTGEETVNNGTSFAIIIENIFPSLLTEKQLQIIKLRYGYDDGKRKTLEHIGKRVGITRERVRQIIVSAHKHLKHPIRKRYLQEILAHIESELLHHKGIVSVTDLSKVAFFSTGTKKQLRFLLNLTAELYEERYRIIENKFLTSLSDDEIKTLQCEIREAVLKCKFPIKEKALTETIILSIGPLSKEYLTYYLLYKEPIVISKRKVLSPGRLSIPKRVKLIMQDIDRPIHFSEIARFYRNHFGDTKIRTSDIEHAIHARIGDSKDFIIVGRGTFILKDKFKIPDNINEIIATSKEILQNLKTISDTKYLISELKKRNIDVGNLNEYSLKPILLEYRGFIKYRKFEVGIEELADKYERKPLNDLMFEILSFTTKPMHVKTIWKEIQKQRGFPEYAIAQRLADDSRFIKVDTAIYTVAKNIAQYEEKFKIIVNFAKEWIQLKGNPLSAFFISEVLKATEEINAFPLGLVAHVLTTNPEFTKLPNGFYDLANRQLII